MLLLLVLCLIVSDYIDLNFENDNILLTPIINSSCIGAFGRGASLPLPPMISRSPRAELRKQSEQKIEAAGVMALLNNHGDIPYSFNPPSFLVLDVA